MLCGCLASFSVPAWLLFYHNARRLGTNWQAGARCWLLRLWHPLFHRGNCCAMAMDCTTSAALRLRPHTDADADAAHRRSSADAVSLETAISCCLTPGRTDFALTTRFRRRDACRHTPRRTGGHHHTTPSSPRLRRFRTTGASRVRQTGECHPRQGSLHKGRLVAARVCKQAGQFCPLSARRHVARVQADRQSFSNVFQLRCPCGGVRPRAATSLHLPTCHGCCAVHSAGPGMHDRDANRRRTRGNPRPKRRSWYGGEAGRSMQQRQPARGTPRRFSRAIQLLVWMTAAASGSPSTP